MVLEVPSQFSLGYTAQSLTCSSWRNHIQGWMNDLNMLLSCSGSTMSASDKTEQKAGAAELHLTSPQVFMIT